MQTEIDFSKPEVPHSGKNCPSTSYEAAHNFKGKAVTIREKVYEFIKASGDFGATAGDIDEEFGLGRNSTSPRITELKNSGFIRMTDLERKNKAGNYEVIWVIK